MILNTRLRGGDRLQLEDPLIKIRCTLRIKYPLIAGKKSASIKIEH
jgi:hypothetical protein